MNLLKYRLYSMANLANPVGNFSPIIPERNAPVLRNLKESYCKSKEKVRFLAICRAFPLCFFLFPF